MRTDLYVCAFRANLHVRHQNLSVTNQSVAKNEGFGHTVEYRFKCRYETSSSKRTGEKTLIRSLRETEVTTSTVRLYILTTKKHVNKVSYGSQLRYTMTRSCVACAVTS